MSGRLRGKVAIVAGAGSIGPGWGNGKATATVEDELSILTELAFAIDDGPWQLGTTTDGIFDSTTESLSIPLPSGLGRGTHTLSIRVADAAGNVGSSTATFVTR